MQSQRPIQLEEFVISIQSLPLADLDKTRTQILTHLKRLSESNSLMEDLMRNEISSSKTPLVDGEDEFNAVDADSTKIYTDSISENLVVIENQKARIEAIDAEIRNRQNDAVPAEGNAASTSGASNTAAFTTDNDLVDTVSNGVYV